MKRVDINEYFKVGKKGGLMTVGVLTCTSIAISYPDNFSYLAHITPTDEIYIDSQFIQFLLGENYQTVFNITFRCSFRCNECNNFCCKWQ